MQPEFCSRGETTLFFQETTERETYNKDAFSLRDEIGTYPNIEVEVEGKINHHSSLYHIVSKTKIKTY